MNNVLIAVDTSESSFWLAYYAIALTKRIPMNVSILMVEDEKFKSKSSNTDEWIGLPEKRLESLLAEGRSDRSHINFYSAKGNFENEVIQFILANNITTLFVGNPENRKTKLDRQFMELLERIGSKTDCHIEVVQKISAYGQ
ncbi:universal stress protein [Maridesulfovibrio zosterae]|uniref:universal stress protein n=1 Tax=Maridesulfovibrio zosterae TaxID=82171 RepID=UPI000408AF6C|nr:universal stress protein [Maridesulfovibrio zosterae]